MKKSLRFLVATVLALLLPLGNLGGADPKKEGEEGVKDEKKGSEKSPTGTHFGVSPPIIDLQCLPGQRVAGSFRIENPHPVATTFSAEPRGVLATGKPSLDFTPIAALPSDHLSRHLTLETSRLVIPPKSFKNFSFFIDVSPGLKGTQYAGLIVTNMSPSLQQPQIKRTGEYTAEVGIGMQPAIGITITCHIQGTETFGIALKKLEVVPPRGNIPLQISGVLKNTGNAEIVFLPLLVLTDANRKVVARTKAESRVTLIPGATTEVKFQPVLKEIPPGTYKAILAAPDAGTKLQPIEQSVVVQEH